MTSFRINFFQEDVNFRLRDIRAIRNWIIASIKSEKRVSGEINIILCSDEYLHKMNVEHLNHDTYTDIITFDYTEGKTINGDLFISLDRVKDNAMNLRTGVKNELHRVMIHGVLHLCGYKDKSLKDSALMREKEDFYLSLRPF